MGGVPGAGRVEAKVRFDLAASSVAAVALSFCGHDVFDSQRLPQTAAYFAGLPQGLDSFDDCMVVNDAFEILLVPETELGGLHAQGLVSHEFVDRIRQVDGQRWVPEVLFQCMAFIMVDLYGAQAYLDWSQNSAYELYDKPLLRHLIKLLSPTLVVMGASSRWAAASRASLR